MTHRRVPDDSAIMGLQAALPGRICPYRKATGSGAWLKSSKLSFRADNGGGGFSHHRGMPFRPDLPACLRFAKLSAAFALLTKEREGVTAERGFQFLLAILRTGRDESAVNVMLVSVRRQQVQR